MEFFRKLFRKKKITGNEEISTLFDDLIIEMRKHFLTTIHVEAKLRGVSMEEYYIKADSQTKFAIQNRTLEKTIKQYNDKLKLISHKVFYKASLELGITPISSSGVRKSHLTEDTIRLSNQSNTINAIHNSLMSLILEGNLLARTKSTKSILESFMQNIKQSILNG